MNTKRGTTLNLHNRFETRSTETFDDGWDKFAEDLQLPVVETQFIPDQTKSIISYNESPDLPMMASINPYRGCEHGCSYCYARPSHEYLGYNSAVDFESKILVKHNAPELLRKEMLKPSWKPQVIMLSGNTDCYQPVERKLGITRKILEVCLEFKNPVGIITKNTVCLRDIDILSEMAKLDLVMMNFSITTLDLHLSRKLEPRTAAPYRKLEAIQKLSEAGVPCGVNNAPIIPGLNDGETPRILEESAKAGAISAGFIMLRLSYGNKDIFTDWLRRNVPMEADKVLKRIMMVRDGKLNETEFGTRMKGEGAYADYIKQQFNVYCRKYHLNEKRIHLSTEHFQRPGTLFG